MLTAKHRQSICGFSMVELVIALVILGITLAIALPSISTWMQNSQIRVAAENIQSGIQLARSEAVRRNANVEFRLDNPAATGGTGWTITVVGENTIVQVMPSGEGTRNVKLLITPAAATSIVFNGFGRLSTVAVTPIEVIDVKSSTLSASDSHDLRLVIIDGSEVRMCDPTVTDLKDPRTCPA